MVIDKRSKMDGGVNGDGGNAAEAAETAKAVAGTAIVMRTMTDCRRFQEGLPVISSASRILETLLVQMTVVRKRTVAVAHMDAW